MPQRSQNSTNESITKNQTNSFGILGHARSINDETDLGLLKRSQNSTKGRTTRNPTNSFGLAFIPNEELREAWKSDLLPSLADDYPAHVNLIRVSFLNFDIAKFQTWVKALVSDSSFYDFSREQSYHNLLFGSVHMLFPGSKSNREKGVGRYDIYVPVIERRCAIIEIKKADEKELGRSVEAALQQIKDKSYQAGLEGDIWLIGIAFSRKSFEIRHGKSKKF